MHAQFKRAVGKMDSPDLQLAIDLAMAQREKDPDPIIFKRLSEKLHLRTINDLKKESISIHDMVISSDGIPEECFESVSFILRKIKDCVMTGNPESDAPENEKALIKHRSPVIPDDFRCPISLELMKDPVIVSTGQVWCLHFRLHLNSICVYMLSDCHFTLSLHIADIRKVLHTEMVGCRTQNLP